MISFVHCVIFLTPFINNFMCNILGTLSHIIIFSPTSFYIIHWCHLQGVYWDCCLFPAHNNIYFIQVTPEWLKSLEVHLLYECNLKLVDALRSVSEAHQWVTNYVRRALNKCLSVLPTFNVRSGETGYYKPAHEPVQTCAWTCSNLHMNLFKSAHEPVQICTWTCSNLHMNLFKTAHEPVQNCTWTCSNLHMNLFKPVHEPVQTCTWTCSNLHMNLFKYL